MTDLDGRDIKETVLSDISQQALCAAFHCEHIEISKINVFEASVVVLITQIN